MCIRDRHGAAGRAAFENNDFRRGPVNVDVIAPIMATFYLQSASWCDKNDVSRECGVVERSLLS